MPSARPFASRTEANKHRRITLTFDNGPEPQVTPAVLDCLARHNVKATFFVLGRKAIVPEGSALVRRANSEGHWIGNHTFTHTTSLGRLDREAALREFEQAEQALASLHLGESQQTQKLFRPPGSGQLGKHLLHPAVVEKLVAGGYSCVLWNSVPGDYRDPEGWLERALSDCQSHDWTLLVLHDLPTGAMAHLEEFLARLQQSGFELRQDFPPECVPILQGKVVLPLDPYVNG
ncbi:MAG: polysaccharide deacetylase family protein [Bryobacteraceae bacterium]